MCRIIELGDEYKKFEWVINLLNTIIYNLLVALLKKCSAQNVCPNFFLFGSVFMICAVIMNTINLDVMTIKNKIKKIFKGGFKKHVLSF